MCQVPVGGTLARFPARFGSVEADLEVDLPADPTIRENDTDRDTSTTLTSIKDRLLLKEGTSIHHLCWDRLTTTKLKWTQREMSFPKSVSLVSIFFSFCFLRYTTFAFSSQIHYLYQNLALDITLNVTTQLARKLRNR